jgi:hypothetical protein
MVYALKWEGGRQIGTPMETKDKIKYKHGEYYFKM